YGVVNTCIPLVTPYLYSSGSGDRFSIETQRDKINARITVPFRKKDITRTGNRIPEVDKFLSRRNGRLTVNAPIRAQVRCGHHFLQGWKKISMPMADPGLVRADNFYLAFGYFLCSQRRVGIGDFWLPRGDQQLIPVFQQY